MGPDGQSHRPDDRQQPKQWRSPLSELSAKTIASIIGGVITAVIAAVLIAQLVGSGSPPATRTATAASPSGPRAFIVEDALYHGTWALSAPSATTLLARDRRPHNARGWLADGTTVVIRCAGPGAAYPVILEGKHQRWHWWAKLAAGDWVAMAAFRQTRVDGSEGFATC